MPLSRTGDWPSDVTTVHTSLLGMCEDRLTVQRNLGQDIVCNVGLDAKSDPGSEVIFRLSPCI